MSHQTSVAPSEIDWTRRSQVEVLPVQIRPVRRKKVIDDIEVVQSFGNHCVGIVAGLYIKSPISRSPENSAIVPDDWTSSTPDASRCRVREKALRDHGMMAVTDIDGIDTGDSVAASLRQRCINLPAH